MKDLLLYLKTAFTKAPSDHSLFIKRTAESFTALIIYVDDIVLAGTSLSEFQSLKDTLQEAFGIKDLGTLKYFLGLEAAHSSKGIHLCQRQYCLDLLTDTSFLGCKPVSTPMEPGSHLFQDDSGAYCNAPIHVSFYSSNYMCIYIYFW